MEPETIETETPGVKARRLIRSLDRASLATAMADGDWPYASLVMTACGQDAAPLLLISDLAEHTKNIEADPRGALLFDGTGGLDNPLTGARVTVLGRLAPSDDEALLARFVARHPDAAGYSQFADFRLFRMEIERAHIVAGFGDIHWIDGADIRFDAAATGPLAAAEPDVVEHMNTDHADAVQLYAVNLLGLEGDNWSLTGVDPEGVDLRNGGAVARLEFDRVADDAEAARAALVRLVKKARATG